MRIPLFIVGLIVTVVSLVQGFKLVPTSHGIAFGHLLQGSRLNCVNTQQEAVKDESTPLKVKLAGGLINALFSVKPLFKFASGKARASMVEKGASIGVDWVDNVVKLEKDMDKLTKIYDSLKSSKIEYPEYYLKPFHAYDDGNLSWQVSLMMLHVAAITDDEGSGFDIFHDAQ